jgi:hypothetical protein
MSAIRRTAGTASTMNIHCQPARGEPPHSLLKSRGSSATAEVGRACEFLKGTKPADLPIFSRPNSNSLSNLKTAKTLGLNLPPTLLAIADEVIDF